jgi:hypothetical protein
MDPAILARALELVSGGMSCKAAAALLGQSNATLARWLIKVKACGGDLQAALDSAAAAPIGRPPEFTPTEPELLVAKWYRLTKESVTCAAYFFARDKARVSEPTREVLLAIEEKAIHTGKRESWPESVRRAFRVTPKEMADFRGKKAGIQEEMITRRGMFELLADGTVMDILPGHVWELDDYSANQPFLYKCPHTGSILLGRQILACRDLCSPKWLGFDHIGRPADAYRGEDIVRTLERLFRAWGRPRRLRLERGSWESSFVHGIEVPGMAARWGDLRDLCQIDHVFKSKGKGTIESGFNVLQKWLGHTGTDLGRHRGEFEEATKRLRQLQTTNVDPESLGFLTQEQSGILHHAAGELINSRPMARQHLGGERVSPDDLTARLGWHTTPWHDDHAWYFLPYKALRTVRGGCVRTSHAASGWPQLHFQINGQRDGIYCENGHQILIAYDPARPDLGCRVCNADLSARNRSGWRMGQVLIPAAPVLSDAPQFAAAGVLSPHLPGRKKAAAAAATSFRAIMAAAGTPGPAATKEAAAFDGKGSHATAGDIARPDAPPSALPINNPKSTIINRQSPAPAEHGPIPAYVRPVHHQPLPESPAWSSRAMPATREGRAAEMARLREALENA